MFISYGDDDLLAHHAVLALDHLVRKAPRALVAEQGGAVCVGSLLGPRQQRRLSERLLTSLETAAPPKDRNEEAAKAEARAALRFGP